MTDRTAAMLVVLGGLVSIGLLSWQSHRIHELEALSASLRHEIEKYDESTTEGTKSLREALRGLNFDLYENRCIIANRGSGKESGHVLP